MLHEPPVEVERPFIYLELAVFGPLRPIPIAPQLKIDRFRHGPDGPRRGTESLPL